MTHIGTKRDLLDQFPNFLYLCHWYWYVIETPNKGKGTRLKTPGFPFKVIMTFTSVTRVPGYYGNEIDGVGRPKTKGKKGGGDGEEEETELIHNSSEEEMDDDGDLTSVATTPPMKPVITDRSEQKYHHLNK